jgi:peptidoglycan hydrolase-like protein with peptidoglycan-binding domain
MRVHVRAFEQLLNAHGFPCEVDGAFDPNTESAVKRFHEARGLGVDGKVGQLRGVPLAHKSASQGNIKIGCFVTVNVRP